MQCNAISSAGARCRMAAMKGQGQEKCFIHAESTAEARKAARQRGAEHANERRAPRPEPSPAPAGTAGGLGELASSVPPPFELGTVEKRADIPASLLRLSRAVASGQIDVRRARVITESLRAAELGFQAGAREDTAVGKAPPGYREATPAEMEHLVRTGQLPDGLQALDEPFWVKGAEFVPPPTALKNAG